MLATASSSRVPLSIQEMLKVAWSMPGPNATQAGSFPEERAAALSSV